MCLDTGHDLAHLAADLYLRAQKLFRFLHCFTSNDLPYLELKLGKIIKSDLRLCLKINAFLFFFCRLFRLGRMKHFYLCHNIFQVQTCEKDLRLFCYFIA